MCSSQTIPQTCANGPCSARVAQCLRPPRPQMLLTCLWWLVHEGSSSFPFVTIIASVPVGFGNQGPTRILLLIQILVISHPKFLLWHLKSYFYLLIKTSYWNFRKGKRRTREERTNTVRIPHVLNYSNKPAPRCLKPLAHWYRVDCPNPNV